MCSKISVQNAEDYKKGLMEIIDLELNLEGLGKVFFFCFYIWLWKISKLQQSWKVYSEHSMPTTYIIQLIFDYIYFITY